MITKIWILAIIIILLMIVGSFLVFRSDQQDKLGNLLLIASIIFTILFTTFQFQQQQQQFNQQFQQQQDQITLDNRPQVFMSGWKKTDLNNTHKLSMKLSNTGKLAAMIKNMKIIFTVDDEIITVDNPQLDKSAYIFPSQDNIWIDIPFSNENLLKMRNKSYLTIEVSFNYYALTDINLENKFYYSTKYKYPIINNVVHFDENQILSNIEAK